MKWILPHTLEGNINWELFQTTERESEATFQQYFPGFKMFLKLLEIILYNILKGSLDCW